MSKKKYERHGESETRLYTIWALMRQRCNNSKSTNYSRYGGKGISVCAEWDRSYIAFKQWAMNNGYTDELTIDRIDSDGDYKPSNCRWIPRSENTRRAIINARKKANLAYVEMDEKIFQGRTLTEIMAIQNAEEEAEQEKRAEHRRKQEMYNSLFGDTLFDF